MYTHFLSLLINRGLSGAHEMKFSREPSDHLKEVNGTEGGFHILSKGEAMK